MSDAEGHTIEHRPGRFRLLADDRELVVLDYVASPGVWDIVHTYSQPAARGTGVASKLVTAVMTAARESGRRIIPSCPYIPVWLSRHPEFRDLVQVQS